MTLQIHEQCFEVCASNCSFKWNRSRAVGKEFNVLLNVNKKIRDDMKDISHCGYIET